MPRNPSASTYNFIAAPNERHTKTGILRHCLFQSNFDDLFFDADISRSHLHHRFLCSLSQTLDSANHGLWNEEHAERIFNARHPNPKLCAEIDPKKPFFSSLLPPPKVTRSEEISMASTEVSIVPAT